MKNTKKIFKNSKKLTRKLSKNTNKKTSQVGGLFGKKKPPKPTKPTKPTTPTTPTSKRPLPITPITPQEIKARINTTKKEGENFELARQNAIAKRRAEMKPNNLQKKNATQQQITKYFNNQAKANLSIRNQVLEKIQQEAEAEESKIGSFQELTSRLKKPITSITGSTYNTPTQQQPIKSNEELKKSAKSIENKIAKALEIARQEIRSNKPSNTNPKNLSELSNIYSKVVKPTSTQPQPLFKNKNVSELATHFLGKSKRTNNNRLKNANTANLENFTKAIKQENIMFSLPSGEKIETQNLPPERIEQLYEYIISKKQKPQSNTSV